MTAREIVSQGIGRAGFSVRSRTSGAIGPDSSLSPTQQSRWWRALEASITVGILAVVILAVANSIARANWIDDQPDYVLIAALALAAAALLGAARLSWPLVTIVAMIAGAVIVLWQVLTVEAVAGQPLFFERFDDLWFRLTDWFDQAFTYGISTDTLPFMLFLSAGVWVATFVGAFLLWRRHNPWVLLIALGTMLAVNVSYLDGKQWDFNFMIFIGGAVLLLTRTHLLQRMQRWESRQAPFPDFISLSFLVAGLLVLITLLVIARALPRPDQSGTVGSVWGTLTSPFDGLNDELRRLFSGIESQTGASVHQFSDILVLQGAISPGEAILMRVQSPEPGLLRGATYDRYISRGWQQTDLDKESLDHGEAILGALGSGVEGYRDRREITIIVSAERSSRVLFSLGLPDVVNRDIKVEQSASIPITLDLLDPNSAPLDLQDAARAIRATQVATAQQVRDAYGLLPPGYIVLGHDRAEDGTAIAVDLENLSVGPDVVALRPKDRVRSGYTYEVTGTISAATADALRSAGNAYPAWVRERFFQLPAELSDSDFARLQALAQEVSAGTAIPFDAALALQNYLCCSSALDAQGAAVLDAEGNPRLRYPFTLEVETAPVDADVVTWWLFDFLAADGYPLGGYFDYHASAVAVLLRTLGIPSRVSTGFLLTAANYDARTESYDVRRLHAHAWVEVYFPEYGWVNFNPTPFEGSLATGGFAVERIARTSLNPFASDIDDEFLFLELELLSEELASVSDFDDFDLGLAAEEEKTFLWWLVPLVGMGVVVMVSGGGVIAWKVSLHGLSPTQRAWKATQRLAAWAGIPADPARTPEEYAAQLGTTLEHDRVTRWLARSYVRERYGGKTLTPEEIGATYAAWRTLRRPLLFRILQRIKPRLPGWL